MCSLLSSAQRADTARGIRSFFPGLTGLEEQKEMQKGLLLNFPNSDEKDTKFHPDTWHTGPQHYTGMSPTCPQTRYAQRSHTGLLLTMGLPPEGEVCWACRNSQDDQNGPSHWGLTTCWSKSLDQTRQAQKELPKCLVRKDYVPEASPSYHTYHFLVDKETPSHTRGR